MSEEYADFKLIKENVSIEMALDRLYDHNLEKVNATTIRGGCILPTHPVDATSRAFSVNIEKQLWICHNTDCQKARQGRRGGDVIELVSVMDKISFREAGIKLSKLMNTSQVVLPKEKSKEKPKTSKSPKSKYGDYSPLCEWVEQLQKNETDEYTNQVLGMILKKAEKMQYV
jgi:hypothetical protein